MRPTQDNSSHFPGFQLTTRGENHLTAEQCQQIHTLSLELLQNTGYVIPLAEARDLLVSAGARAEGKRVFIPPELVERALQTVYPITLFNRQGEPTLPLSSGKGQVAFGAMVDTLQVVDPYLGQVRRWKNADVLWFATVLDALPNIDWVACIGEAEDIPDNLLSQFAVTQTMRRTTKPVMVFPYDRAGLLDILEILNIVAGCEQAFCEKPFLFCASVASAPLVGSNYNLEILLTCAEHCIPLLYYSSPAIGSNVPASLAGTLLMGNADWLANLAIHQLKRPNAPFVSAGFTVQLMDMRSTLWSYCAPETLPAYSAIADLAHWYGMPAFGLEMTSDTPRLDAQAGMEMMAQCNLAFQSGTEMVHNTGMFGANKLFASEANVLADEIIGYTRAAYQPARLNSPDLDDAARLIHAAGPEGEYVTHEHTLRHFKDFWYPSIFSRQMFDPEAIHIPELGDRLNARVRRLIETHNPVPLTSEVEAEISKLEKVWIRRGENTEKSRSVRED